MEALENQEVSTEKKQKMLEMLDRLEKEEVDNELEKEECDELSQRLTGLDLDTDTDLIWNRLTEQEKAQFNKMVKDGHLADLVEIWTPWWNVKEKISEVDSVKENQAPAVIQKIPDISKLLTKSKPSADIRNNIVNVLYAYVFVCHLYNGTHWDCPQEAALKLVNASDVLANNSVCSSPSEAVQLCMANREYQQSQDFLVGVVDDVVKILQGPGGGGEDQRFVLAALSDILKLLKKCHSQYKKDIKLSKAASSDTEEEKQLLYRAIKKTEFFLGWCQKCGMVLLSILPELRLEYSRLTEELEETNQVKESIKRNLTELRPPATGSKLIEELT
ncbi:uncharacterized protein LOC133174160 isoform X2 [Saccostrea echinata]|uniref:uncharacterized protein LOC133174160 isoform X2 n=1 Tax=Saccostrea echinata TaxID=191078 RepID=UPI002A8187F2|nr:uncharacterized protein LOC133174160 isoform X2 [Saccostrea echinata]